MPKHTLKDEIHIAYNAMHHVAKRTERPLHLLYFALVCWSANASYGYVAGVCAIVMVLSRDDPSAS